MKQELIKKIRKLSQQYAYASLQMHETIGLKAGLSGTDHKYLGFLLEKGKMTAGELAQLSGLTTGAVTGLVDRFEKRGLVQRQFAAEDRRKVFIVPETEKIMALLAPLYQDFRNESEILTTSFTEKEIHIIGTYLQKSIEIMQATTNKYNQ